MKKAVSLQNDMSSDGKIFMAYTGKNKMEQKKGNDSFGKRKVQKQLENN